MTTLYLPVEISTREYPWKVIFAQKCAKAGYRTIIGYKPLIQELACSDKGGVYFDKGYHEGKSDALYATLKSNGFKIISLDEEGAVDWNNSQSLQVRYPKNLKDKVDYILMWGREQKNNFYKDIGNVLTTGHPRFKFAKSENHKAVMAKTMLIITNASFGNNHVGEDEIISRYGSRIKNIDSLLELDQTKVSTINEIARVLSNEYKVTLRIHPEENSESYKKSGLSINISKNPLDKDIKQHDIIIHFDSSVAIDVLGTNVPVISIAKILETKNEFLCPLPIMASDYIPDTLQELYEIIRSGYLRKIDKDLNKLERYFEPTDIDKFFNRVINLFPIQSPQNRFTWKKNK